MNSYSLSFLFILSSTPNFRPLDWKEDHKQEVTTPWEIIMRVTDVLTILFAWKSCLTWCERIIENQRERINNKMRGKDSEGGDQLQK